jgi:hypothetical protein
LGPRLKRLEAVAYEISGRQRIRTAIEKRVGESLKRPSRRLAGVCVSVMNGHLSRQTAEQRCPETPPRGEETLGPFGKVGQVAQPAAQHEGDGNDSHNNEHNPFERRGDFLQPRLRAEPGMASRFALGRRSLGGLRCIRRLARLLIVLFTFRVAAAVVLLGLIV